MIDRLAPEPQPRPEPEREVAATPRPLPGIVGYATWRGQLYLYTDPEAMRSRIDSLNFSQAGWVDGASIVGHIAAERGAE